MSASHKKPTPTELASDAHKNRRVVNTLNRPTRNTPYHDRTEAGECLAQEILLALSGGGPATPPGHRLKGTSPLARREPVVVLGLCRGGVPVARTVARLLRVPFDFLVVRKLASEANPELAIGALAECGRTDSGRDAGKKEVPQKRLRSDARRGQKPGEPAQESGLPPDLERTFGVIEVLNRDILAHLPDAEAALTSARDRETEKLRRRVMRYRAGKAPERLERRRVILVDDGAATGATMRAAIASARKQGAAEVIVALPVAPEEVCGELRHEADKVICPWTPAFFMSVGSHYTHFPQIEDEEICGVIQRQA